jgi:O-methyltransferase involved in polyketide biosynthesis
LPQNPAVTFVESDLPAMVQKKQQLVQQLIGNRSNLHLLPINATSRPNPLLQISHFNSTVPVTILCEGLLMYLTFPEKQQICVNVREMLQTHGGVWITPDFTTKMGAGQMRQQDLALSKVNQKIASSTGRSFTECEFEDLDHAREFISKQGFRIEEYSMLEVIDQLACLTPLSIDRERAKPLLAATPVFALTIA